MGQVFGQTGPGLKDIVAVGNAADSVVDHVAIGPYGGQNGLYRQVALASAIVVSGLMTGGASPRP